MNSHTHGFAEADWPFVDSIDTMAYTTKPVLHGGLPILLVTHDVDGDWQFLCGTTNETGDAAIVCLGCMFDQDKTVGDVADLPRRWIAWRNSAGDPWIREPRPSDWEE